MRGRLRELRRIQELRKLNGKHFRGKGAEERMRSRQQNVKQELEGRWMGKGKAEEKEAEKGLSQNLR